MIENLVILESPTKAKTVGKILGSKYMVIASAGHIRDLPEHTMAVDIENSFEPKYVNLRSKISIINEIVNLAGKAKHVYLASDPDREGEAIAWHISVGLKLDQSKVKRITFKEITKKGIQEGISNPRDIDQALVDAYQARRVLDRLVGYSISPILCKKVHSGLSAGRVQSVALRLICEREEEIKAFKAREYWTLNGSFSKKGFTKSIKGLFYGKDGKKIEICNEREADDLLNKMSGKDAYVSEIKKNEKRQAPFAPFTTSTLQQDAAHKLNFTAGKTMQVAQKLYEGINLGALGTTGLITYMRTDSVRISDEAAFEAKKHITDKFGDAYVPSKRRFFKNKSQAQDAHEAIRPAHIDIEPDSIKSFLTADEYKLYNLIYNRFIASQMADAVYECTSLTVNVGDYDFKASGKTTLFNGFEAQYDVGFKEDESEEDYNKSLPNLTENEVLNIKAIEKNQHFTQPPARFNEASLVKTLEELGIGRPSTYASILGNIESKNYVAREKKSLYPTDLGVIVNEIIVNNFPDIVDVAFTANVEKELDSIAQNEIFWKDVIRDFYTPFEVSLNEAKNQIKKVEIPAEYVDGTCEICGKRLVLKNGKNGEFIACEGYLAKPKTCNFTKSVVKEVGKTCPDCGKVLVYRKSKTGKQFIGCTGYPTCKFTTIYEPTGSLCPKCGKYLIYKRRGKFKYITCSDEKCGYTPSKEKKKEGGEE